MLLIPSFLSLSLRGITLSGCTPKMQSCRHKESRTTPLLTILETWVPGPLREDQHTSIPNEALALLIVLAKGCHRNLPQN